MRSLTLALILYPLPIAFGAALAAPPSGWDCGTRADGRWNCRLEQSDAPGTVPGSTTTPVDATQEPRQVDGAGTVAA
ncbi:MAG: hypothetical protein WAM94_09235, partial [Chromatiaceae bacterium]